MSVAVLIAGIKKFKGRIQNGFLNFRVRVNWFDISNRIDTSGRVDLEDLYATIDSPNKSRMIRYVPTGFEQIRKSLGRLIEYDRNVLEGGLVDFGCGKGRVLIMAAQMGFKRVTGVEFSKTLYEICRRNLKKVKSQAEVVCEDAVNFRLTGDERVFYFYNPFNYSLVQEVLENIYACLKIPGKTGYVVYVDPRQFGRLDPERYEMIISFDGPGTPFHVYKVVGGQ